MTDEIIFTREDSDRLVTLEQQMAQQTALLNLILAQTTKTNGRVTLSESKIEVLEKVNEKTSGAKGMMGIFWVMTTTLAGLYIAYKFH